MIMCSSPTANKPAYVRKKVRRANFKLTGPEKGNVTKQAIVLRSDKVDEASHTPVLDFPVLGFYGATAWYNSCKEPTSIN